MRTNDDRPSPRRVASCTLAGLFLLVACSSAGEPSPAPTSPPRVLTLHEVCARVLTNSPALSVFTFDIRAAEARAIQAGLRPNPELAIEIEDLRLGGPAREKRRLTTIGLGIEKEDRAQEAPGTDANAQANGAAAQDKQGLAAIDWGGRKIAPSIEYERESERGSGGVFSEAEFTISLSQIIELGGKRARRVALAHSERDTATWQYEIARADALKEASQVFTDLLAAQERVALEADLVKLAEQVVSTVAARVQAGRVSPLEEKKAKTALASATLRADQAQRALESTRYKLAALWGDLAPTFDRAEGSLESVREIPALASIAERVTKNPELAQWSAIIAERDAARALEKAKATPDLTVTAGIRARRNSGSHGENWALDTQGVRYSRSSSDPDDAWDALAVLGVSVPIPLFDRNQGAIAEAEHLAAKASEERRATALRVHAALVEAYQALSDASATIRTLKAEVLPAAQETFVCVNEAYRQGKFGFMDVLDAQRTLFEARQQYWEALAAFHRGVAEVERLIGEPLYPEDAHPAPSTKE